MSGSWPIWRRHPLHQLSSCIHDHHLLYTMKRLPVSFVQLKKKRKKENNKIPKQRRVLKLLIDLSSTGVMCSCSREGQFFFFFVMFCFFVSVCRCCSQISPKCLSPESLREFAVQRGLQGQTWSHPHLFMKMMKVNKTPLFVPSRLPRLLFWISIHSCASSQLERCTAAPSAYNWTCAA